MEPKIEAYEIALLLLLAILNQDSSYLFWVLGVVGDRVSDKDQERVWALVGRVANEKEKVWLKDILDQYR